MHKYEEALKQLESLNADSPEKEAEISFRRGLTYYAMGVDAKKNNDDDKANIYFDQAKCHIKQTINLNKNNARAILRLGMIQSIHDHDFLSALKNFDEANRLAPSYSDILYVRGSLHVRLGHIHTGLDDKRRALQLNQESMTSNESLHDTFKDVLQKAQDNLDPKSKLYNAKSFLRVALLLDGQCRDNGNNENGNEAKALEKYKAAYQKCEKNEERLEVLAQWALSYHEKSMFREAYGRIFCIRFLMKEDPNMFSHWDNYLKSLRDEKERYESSSSELLSSKLDGNTSFDHLIQHIIKRIDTLEKDVLNTKVLICALSGRIEQLEDINKNLMNIKRDEEYFDNEDNFENEDKPHKNRLDFYKTMREELERLFVALATTKSFGNVNVVQHNLRGSLSK